MRYVDAVSWDEHNSTTADMTKISLIEPDSVSDAGNSRAWPRLIAGQELAGSAAAGAPAATIRPRPAFRALEHEPPVVEGGDRRAMRDGDDRGLGQAALQRLVEMRLRLRVEARGRLVEEQPIGLRQQGAGEGDPLLLAAGKALRPVLVLVQMRNETRRAPHPPAPAPPAACRERRLGARDR